MSRIYRELEYNRSKAQLQFLQTLAPGFDSSDPSLMTTECVICRDATPLRIGILPCGHIFCSDCIRGIASNSLRLQCPLCRMTIRPTDVSHVAVPQAPVTAAPARPASVDATPATRASHVGGGSATQSALVSESAQSSRMFSPDAIASSIASLCPASSVAIDEDSHLVEDEVIGSWSSRISGIVGRLLRIRRNFPNSKTIVFSQCKTCVTRRVTRHTSHVTRHTSHITHHTSHITHHTSHITHHTSHIIRHTSHVTPHTSQGMTCLTLYKNVPL